MAGLLVKHPEHSPHLHSTNCLDLTSPQGSASPQQRPLSRVSPGGFPAVSPPPPAESPIRGHPARGGAEADPGFLATGDDAWADAPTVEVLLPLQSLVAASGR